MVPILPAAGSEGSHLKARMLHRMLAFAVQYVQVSVSDLQVTYSQRDDPGPAPAPGCHLQGRDCLQLSIRQIALLPAGACTPAAEPAAC